MRAGAGARRLSATSLTDAFTARRQDRELPRGRRFRTREGHGSMQHLSKATSLRGRDRTLRLAFVSAVVSMVVAFGAVGSAIPLFNIYRAEDGFTNADITLTVVVYS